MGDYFTLEERQKILSFVSNGCLQPLDLTVLGECFIIKNESIEDVIAFIKKRRPSIRGQIELIKRGDIDLINAFYKYRNQFNEEAINFLCENSCDEIVMLQLSKGYLPEKAQNIVVDKRNHDLIMAYPFFTSEYAQIAVLKRNNQDEIKRMLSRVSLSNNALKLFLQIATTELVLYYILHSKEAFSDVRALFSREIKEEILAYLNKFNLGNDDVILFERGYSDEISVYLNSARLHNFSEKGQTMFLERGIHNEIMNYIERRHKFSDKNAILLIQRKNREEIMACVFRQKLFEDATHAFVQWADTKDLIWFLRDGYGYDMSVKTQNLLLERGVPEEILAHIARVSKDELKGFSGDVVISFLKTRTTKELIAYINRFDIDKTEESIIINRGITEVIVQYIKTKYIHNPALIINRGNKQEVRALFESLGANVDLLLAQDAKINQLLKEAK